MAVRRGPFVTEEEEAGAEDLRLLMHHGAVTRMVEGVTNSVP